MGFDVVRVIVSGGKHIRAEQNTTFDFIAELTEMAHAREIEVLVEIHSHYLEQIEIAKRVDFVYDFALPPLVLHALYAGDARRQEAI